MLTNVRLQNFKCFRDQSIKLRSLTLLAGLNGGGKSSVIQALLILRQSFREQYFRRSKLLLGGDLVDLGAGLDVLWEEATDDLIGISVDVSTGARGNFVFRYDRGSDQLAAQDPRELAESVQQFEELPLFASNFLYIGADRIGPRKMAQMSDARLSDHDVGVAGEYVLHSLAARGDESLLSDDARIIDGASRSLKDQVDLWMQVVSPGSHIEIELVRAADIAIAAFKFDREGDVPTRGFRSTNVGFGLSYALPVVFALVSAEAGSLVIIENPEAHLHPYGQTKLGQLAARAASMGVQVVVETHSDHFMDGIRIDVRDGRLNPEECAFNYFVRKGAEAIVETPMIDRDGRLSHWPTGFFDQHENNLALLLTPK
jgi:predicted ATPase